MSDKLSVAVIGLGRMGGAIARRIQGGGFTLTVHNRSAAKAAPLLALGAHWAATPRDAAAEADVVITSLMDDRSVMQASERPDGILAGLRPGSVHLCATTISPGVAESLGKAHAAQGSVYVAAPVLGRPAAAAAGQLATLLAGPDAAIERCQPVIATYASRIVKLGPVLAVANNAKLLANYVAYACLDLTGQVHAFGERGGIPPGFVSEMLDGLFAHPALREYNDRIAHRRYDDVEFDTRAGLKDLDLISVATGTAGAPLAYAGVVRDRFLAAIANGFGDKDMCAIAEITRGLAGLGRSSGAST